MSETRRYASPAGSTGPADSADPAGVGSVLGSYRILGELSRGSMGTILRAEHVLLHRPAAIKLLRAELSTDLDLVARFIDEAKAVTACKHPGIVEIYDFGYAPGGRAFIVMELLAGESLGHRLARVRLGEREAVAIASGIASALKAAHKVGVIHRDLKPDNVFLVPDPDGGPDRTKVLDFGIAKLTDGSADQTSRTRTGMLIGTPLYMAPEQARAAGTIDPRADLYSLGCILYHMLAGRPPFVAEGAGEIIALQMFGAVVPPSRLAQVTSELEWVVLRLLEKEPAHRFDSAAALAAALAAFDTLLANRPSSPSSSFVPSPFSDLAPTLPPVSSAIERVHAPTPVPAPRRRSARSILAGAIAVLGVVGGGLAYAVLRDDGAPPAIGSAAGSAVVDPVPVAAPAARSPSPPVAAPPVAAPPVAAPPVAAPPVAAPPVAAPPVAAPAVAAPPVAPPSTAATAQSSGSDERAAQGPRAVPGGRGATKPAARGDARTGPGPGPSPGAVVPDRANPAGEAGPAGEVRRDPRRVDSPPSGAYTPGGSPMETSIDLGTKQPKPAVPGAPEIVLPSPSPSKGAPSP